MLIVIVIVIVMVFFPSIRLVGRRVGYGGKYAAETMLVKKHPPQLLSHLDGQIDNIFLLAFVRPSPSVEGL
jgi:hypothetical protein